MIDIFCCLQLTVNNSSILFQGVRKNCYLLLWGGRRLFKGANCDGIYLNCKFNLIFYQYVFSTITYYRYTIIKAIMAQSTVNGSGCAAMLRRVEVQLREAQRLKQEAVGREQRAITREEEGRRWEMQRRPF